MDPVAGLLMCKRPVGGGLVEVTLDVAANVAAKYTYFGQFIRAEVGEERGYFALFSEPLAQPFRLLVKPQPGVVDALLALTPGAAVTFSGPLGAGFPEADATPVFVVAGSGLAAVYAWIATLARTGAAPQLFLGILSLEDIPLLLELTQLHRDGARITLCVSGGQPLPNSARHPHFALYSGRAQAAALLALPHDTLSDVVAVGHFAMLDELRQHAHLRVLTNV